MKERGIIFNTDMVRAILSGNKTQVRRIMKVQPVLNGNLYEAFGAGWSKEIKSVPAVPGHSLSTKCPLGSIGDLLWVRETFNGFWLDDEVIQEIKDGISLASELCDYRADFPDGSSSVEGWTPSSQMPRWASRITLEITGVRVERLQDISEADARAEGITDGGCLNCGETEPCGCSEPKPCAVDAFAHLWQTIYGEDNWFSNPWVWVIEFREVK